MTIKTKRQDLIFTVIINVDNINFVSISTNKSTAYKTAMRQALGYIGAKNVNK